MRTGFRSKGIRAKLIFWFFMIASAPLLTITAIDTYAPVKTPLWSRVIFLLGAGAVVCVIAIFLARSISKPIVNMTKTAEKMQAGDFSVRYRMESHDEIGSLARSLNTMTDTISSQIAVQRGSAEIMETMATSNELHEAIEDLLKKLIDLTGSDFGAYYILNESNNRFENLGSIGISSELLKPFKADIREGQLGKALSTKSVSVIRDFPHDTIFTFKTSTETVLPREIMTVPLIAKSGMTAIIALASLHEYSCESIEILDRSSAGMSASTSNLIAKDKTRQLAETLNIKNEELQSQAEEFRSQSKELQEQNAELKAQSEELQKENAELKARSEQLQDHNAELQLQICSDESLVSNEQDEALEDDPALSGQKNRGELMSCQMKSGGEEGLDLGASPAAISTAHGGMTGWGAFGRKLRRSITDGVRLRRRKDSSQECYSRRVERIEKRLRKFIETDSEDTLPKTGRS